MKITFVVSQYKRISGGNRALLEYSNRLQDRGLRSVGMLLQSQLDGIGLTTGRE